MEKTTKPIDDIGDMLVELVVTAYHRDCLGKSGYIVGACIEWLNRNWDSLDAVTQCLVVHDTVEALMDKRAGDDCDIRAWTDFARHKIATLSKDYQRRVHDSLAYKHCVWPLEETE